MVAAVIPQTSAGTTFAISASLPATYDNTGFSALTYTTVAHVNDLGDFGRDYTTVSYTSLGQRGKGKLKSSYDNGSTTVQMHRVISGAGQALIRTASTSDASYSCCVTIQDGTKFYFTALITSFVTKVGGVDNILGATAKMEVSSDIIEV